MDDSERTALIEELARVKTGFGFDGVAGNEARRRSPACGDEVTVRVDVADGIVSSLRWEGHGCVVSTAAASALAALAPGLSVPELAALAARYFASLDPDARPDDHPALADTDVFAGIGRFPLRAGCASLAWRTALDAMAT